MAAPVAVTRIEPPGRFLEDGFSTKITIGLDPDVAFWEKSVTPPGYDGGDAIDVTTMWNEVVRTKAARSLIDTTESSGTAAYSPAVDPLIRALVNKETTITILFPNGDTLAFFGYLRVWEPDELSEGNFPEASFTITPTNRDPATGDEELPVFTAFVPPAPPPPG